MDWRLCSQSHLAPLLLNVQCWVAPRNFALGHAGEAFDAQGAPINEAHRNNVQAVIDQVLLPPSAWRPDRPAST